MRLSAISLSRVLGFVEIIDLSPRGRIFLPELVSKIAQQFSFQKFPKPLDELDESKGIEFFEGKIGEKVIQKLAIFNTLLVLETRSTTDDSKRILEDMLEWGAQKCGLDYKPGMITRFAYVSDLTFYSDVPLLSVSSALAKVAAKTSEALTDIWQEPVRYEPINLIVGHDPTARKYPIAPFSIARRAEARFSENKYFSEAPLPTSLHIRLLEEFEKEVAALLK
jgi:hypothetical protein